MFCEFFGNRIWYLKTLAWHKEKREEEERHRVRETEIYRDKDRQTEGRVWWWNVLTWLLPTLSLPWMRMLSGVEVVEARAGFSSSSSSWRRIWFGCILGAESSSSANIHNSWGNS
jgi:hypothetical protein